MTVRRWHPDRPWWRRVLAFPGGCCWHFTHPQDECTATWQRVWPDEVRVVTEPAAWEQRAMGARGPHV